MKYLFGPVLLFASGCGVLDPGRDCTLIQIDAMRVEVIDSASMNPFTEQATVTFRDGMFADTVHLSGAANDGDPTAVLDHDRPGTYSVEVFATGYSPWSRTGIIVPESNDGCHAETVTLTARLQRLGGS